MIEDGGRTGGKRTGSRGTAFYIEALLLAAVFTVVILTLTRVFAWSGQRGRDAALLTGAVHLAENGAEAVAASRSLEEVRELLEEDGNGEMLAQADGQGAADAGFPTLRMHYDDDLNPAPEGTVWMDIQWIPASGQDGDGASPEEGLVKSVITVSRAGAQELVYRLETEVFTGLDLSRDGF